MSGGQRRRILAAVIPGRSESRSRHKDRRTLSLSEVHLLPLKSGDTIGKQAGCQIRRYRQHLGMWGGGDVGYHIGVEGCDCVKHVIGGIPCGPNQGRRNGRNKRTQFVAAAKALSSSRSWRCGLRCATQKAGGKRKTGHDTLKECGASLSYNRHCWNKVFS